MPDYGKVGISDADRVNINDLRSSAGTSNLGGTSILEVWRQAFQNSDSESHWQTRYGHLDDANNTTNFLTEAAAAADETDELKSITGDFWSRKLNDDGQMTTQGFYDTTYESTSTPGEKPFNSAPTPGTTNYSLHRSPENYFITRSGNTPLWSGADSSVNYTSLPSADDFEQRGMDSLKNYDELNSDD